MKKISIIMPVYNVEKYLKTSINGVLNQTYKDFELIIVDDGSTDSSVKIVDEYSRLDERIRVIHKSNGGLSDARNAGIPYISGDYTLFIDSDDYWEKDLLESIVAYNKDDKIDVVVFGYILDFYDHNDSITSSENTTENTKIIDKKNHAEVDIRHKHLLGYAWNKAYRSTLIISNNLTFKRGVSYIEDVLFNSSIFELVETVGFLDRPLYHYAQRSTETLGKKYYDDIDKLDILANQAFCKILVDLNVLDSDIAAFSSQNIFTKARWSVGIISNTDKIDRKTKVSKIRKILTYLNGGLNPSLLPYSPKESIYLFLFKHYMINVILLIENIKSKNVKRFLRDIVPNSIKDRILYITSRNNKYDHLNKDVKKIIITLVPDHGNVGDLAIGYAQQKFFKDFFKDYEVIEITLGKTYLDLRSIKKKITENDIIAITGGGDLGNLYEDIENQRRFIVNKFRKNTVISLPQSMYFTPDSDGLNALNKSKAIYSKHRKLIHFAREEPSYHLIKQEFYTNTIYLTPDIVLYLNEDDPEIVREKNKITLSIRQDKESNLSENQKQELLLYLQKKNMTITYKDTHIGNVSKDIAKRMIRLNEVWDVFKSSEIVITDRLHGMIFCAITKTPCIAINNNNGKVAGVYKKWLKDINYISMVDGFSMSRIKENFEYLHALTPKEFNNCEFSEEFKRMSEIIAESIVN